MSEKKYTATVEKLPLEEIDRGEEIRGGVHVCRCEIRGRFAQSGHDAFWGLASDGQMHPQD